MFEKEMHAFTKINLNFSTLLTGKTSQSTGSKNELRRISAAFKTHL